MALIGIARAFEIDFTPYLNPHGLQLFRGMQTTSIVNVLGQPHYWRLEWTDVVKPEYPTPESLPLFVTLANELIMGTGPTCGARASRWPGARWSGSCAPTAGAV